jgi:ABC-type antimicrobial peptide transport system permease subunit
MSESKKNPPRLAEWFLEKILRQEDCSHRIGDFEEVFHSIAEESGFFNANKWYWSQVIRSIPGLLSNLIYWSLIMFKSYFKIAIRNLYKNKLYSFINIFGLGVAIAVCIVGYVNYQFSQSYDTFHQNAENIYLLNTYRIVNENRQNMASSPTLLAPTIQENLPGVDKYTRIAQSGGVLRYEEKVFNETLYYVDDNFFDVFTFPMLMGEKDALKDKNSVVITDEIAVKYYGNENPIGKQIIINPSGETEYSFFVRGVIEKPSSISSLRPSVCIPYERQEEMLGYDLKAWNDWTSAAFIQTSPEVIPSHIERQMQDYTQIVNEANPQFPVNGFYLTPLLQLAFVTRDTGGPFFQGFHPAAIIAPSVVALLILLLACFNFVNTSIAYASGRLKEIGIRKVIGGMRSQLIKQFLGENLILCFIALLLGILLAKPFTNFYDNLFPEFYFYLDYLENPGLLIFLIGLLLFTAIASGAYPAFYISKFNPVSIFRGKQQLGGTNPLIRVLITFQFAVSILAIISGIVLYKNSAFIENFDLGFDKEQVLVVPVRGEKNYNLLKSTIESHPAVVSIGASQHLMGRSWTRRDIEVDDIKTRIAVFDIGENYFETTGFRLAEGKSFNHNLKADAEQSVMVNETMVKTYGIESAVGRYIKFNSPTPGREYRVIGIVKDFHLVGLWREVEPMALRYTPPERYLYLSVKFNLNNAKIINEYIQTSWKKLFPHLPYDGFFQTEILLEALNLTESLKLLFIYIAVIVIITSGMGLFALVSLNIVKRTKEIGIRRVLGATFTDISFLISREFILLVLIAGVLGSVMGYFAITAFMSSIWVYYVDFGIMPFIFSALLLFVLAILTVSSQVFSVATSNPTDSLRYE